MNPILTGEGSLKNIGLDHGECFSPAIRSNLRSFWSLVEGQGIRKQALSAATMEIDQENPRRSKTSFALGKPCHAWRDKKGHVELNMSMDSSSIPADLTSGEAWKKFYQEEARD